MERGVMPHLKCVPCRARVLSGLAYSDVVIDLCPGCGAPLERVTELAEIVGFRSIRPCDDAGMSDANQRLADRVRDFRGAYAQPTAKAIALPVSEHDR